MWLNLQAFGLTELRFYATAFMLWLALVLSWFAATVLLRDRRNRFAFGVLLSGFAAMILLNAVNPDAVIARVNIKPTGKTASASTPYYLTTLSADAAPVLVAALYEIGDKPLYERRAGRRSTDDKRIHTEPLQNREPRLAHLELQPLAGRKPDPNRNPNIW